MKRHALGDRWHYGMRFSALTTPFVAGGQDGSVERLTSCQQASPQKREHAI